MGEIFQTGAALGTVAILSASLASSASLALTSSAISPNANSFGFAVTVSNSVNFMGTVTVNGSVDAVNYFSIQNTGPYSISGNGNTFLGFAWIPVSKVKVIVADVTGSANILAYAYAL